MPPRSTSSISSKNPEIIIRESKNTTNDKFNPTSFYLISSRYNPIIVILMQPSLCISALSLSHLTYDNVNVADFNSFHVIIHSFTACLCVLTDSLSGGSSVQCVRPPWHLVRLWLRHRHPSPPRGPRDDSPPVNTASSSLYPHLALALKLPPSFLSVATDTRYRLIHTHAPNCLFWAQCFKGQGLT